MVIITLSSAAIKRDLVSPLRSPLFSPGHLVFNLPSLSLEVSMTKVLHTAKAFILQ